MVSRLRAVFLLLVLVPQAVIFQMTKSSPLAADKYFGQAAAIALAVSLLLVLALPGMTVEWLAGKRLMQLRRFCSQVRQGNYRQLLALPNESCDGDGEEELTVLMRDMNWMARQIEVRENDLQKAVSDLSQSRQQIGEQNKYLTAVNAELLATQQQLEQRTTELEEACRNMQVMAMTDPLTSIANRRCFFETMERNFAALMCNCRPISLLILDIDRFKMINDTYGHQAGDKVLLELAEIIQNNTREGDLAARIGGEEYALLLPDTSLQEAKVVAGRIRAIVQERVFVLDESHQAFVTVSIGVCTLARLICVDRNKLYHYADQALYYSKHNGRNRISIYDPDTHSIGRAESA